MTLLEHPMPMKSLFDVRGKVALVTGGAQGLGRMVAAGLVTAGARVLGTYAMRPNCRAFSTA